jgi:HEPN domain-containing protein
MMHINRANVISECQVGIELAVKAMFKSVGENPPQKHGIHFSDAEALLNIEERTEFDRANEIPRALFLTRFWHEFYEEAKYGYPDQNVLPSDIFRNEDVKRAISDAEFCTELSKELIDCLMEEETKNSKGST